MPLFLDFETRSNVDLKKVGAHRYAEDPSTELLCAGWALGEAPVERWHRGEPLDWMLYVQHPTTIIVAHNAEFERLILRHVLHTDLPASRFRCTAALLARYGLPRSLDAGGRALGVEHLKDAAGGKRLIQKLSKPRRPSRANPAPFWEEDTAPDDFDSLYVYNEGDVETMRDIYHVLPPLSDYEQALWELTVKMNDRGLAVDLESVELMRRLALAEHERLAERWFALTGVPAGSPNSAKALGLSSVDKMHVRHALRREDLTPRVHEALTIRKRLARSSLGKLDAVLKRVSWDGRYRGGLVYGGAERTTRWSSYGVQLHNFPIGLGPKTDVAFQALRQGAMPLLYDDLLQTLSEMLKGIFIGPYIIGDFAQIEARILAWLARQTDLIAAFAAGDDVYSSMATDIYGEPVDRESYDDVLHMPKRQLGKIVILGCGFGLGAAKLATQMDEKFDVVLDEETADNLIQVYRHRYPAIPVFWGQLETLFRTAVRDGGPRIRRPGSPLSAGTQSFAGRPFAYVTLPSGGALWYYRPEADRPGKWPSGDPKTSGAYFGRIPWAGGTWGVVDTYGGKLTENVVQRTARDALGHALLRLDKAGFPLVLTVHDDVTAEGREQDREEFERIMMETPEWAEGLPIAVETCFTRRYRKG